MDLGFKKEHAEVYLFLATRGPRKAENIASELKMYKRQLYRVLRHLESEGVIAASLDHPTLFSAVLFEKVLDLFIETKMEQQKALQASKEELLSIWRSLTKKRVRIVNYKRQA